MSVAVSYFSADVARDKGRTEADTQNVYTPENLFAVPILAVFGVA